MASTQSSHNNELTLKNKMKQIWTKLTEDEIECYERRRDVLLYVLQKKYDVTPQQAENALRHMEEQSRVSRRSEESPA